MNRNELWHVSLNGEEFLSEPKYFETDVLSMIPDLKYWSQESLLELNKGLAEMAVDFAVELSQTKKGEDRAKLLRFVNARLKYLKIPIQSEYIMSHIYDRILASESCGRLPGFGFTNKHRDKLTGNPERRSVV